MKTLLTILLAVTFHDAIAMALVYLAKGILWLALQISALAEIL
jgi:hypothetical protein